MSDPTQFMETRMECDTADRELALREWRDDLVEIVYGYCGGIRSDAERLVDGLIDLARDAR